MDEFELIKQCISGNRESQRFLYESYAPKMLGICYRYSKSREEAEDILQEAFILVFKKIKQFQGKGKLGAWIRRIVVNTSINHIRKKHKFELYNNTISIDQIPMMTSSVPPVTEKEIMEYLHLLPFGCQLVFNLYVIEGYSHEEIGKILSIKASTSRSQLVRAREILMRKLSSNIKSDSHA